jgi:hypothetical protein
VPSFSVIALLGSLSNELAKDAARGDSFLRLVPCKRRSDALTGGVEATGEPTGEESGRGTLDVYSLDVRFAYIEPLSLFCLFLKTPFSVAARDTGRGLASSSGSSVAARRERRSEVPERGSFEIC